MLFRKLVFSFLGILLSQLPDHASANDQTYVELRSQAEDVRLVQCHVCGLIFPYLGNPEKLQLVKTICDSAGHQWPSAFKGVSRQLVRRINLK